MHTGICSQVKTWVLTLKCFLARGIDNTTVVKQIRTIQLSHSLKMQENFIKPLKILGIHFSSWASDTGISELNICAYYTLAVLWVGNY